MSVKNANRLNAIKNLIEKCMHDDIDYDQEVEPETIDALAYLHSRLTCTDSMHPLESENARLKEEIKKLKKLSLWRPLEPFDPGREVGGEG